MFITTCPCVAVDPTNNFFLRLASQFSHWLFGFVGCEDNPGVCLLTKGQYAVATRCTTWSDAVDVGGGCFWVGAAIKKVPLALPHTLFRMHPHWTHTFHWISYHGKLHRFYGFTADTIIEPRRVVSFSPRMFVIPLAVEGVDSTALNTTQLSTVVQLIESIYRIEAYGRFFFCSVPSWCISCLTELDFLLVYMCILMMLKIHSDTKEHNFNLLETTMGCRHKQAHKWDLLPLLGWWLSSFWINVDEACDTIK